MPDGTPEIEALSEAGWRRARALIGLFKKDHEPALVKAARDVGGVVLIAWQHEAIPAIARLIRGGGDGMPEIWPSERFDLVWVFDRLQGDQWSFTQVAQRILPGDQTGPALSAPLVAATEPGAGARFSS